MYMQKSKLEQLQDLKLQLQSNEKIDQLYGYDYPCEPGVYRGFLINFQETQIIKETVFSALDCYFISNSNNFKVQIQYKPYVLIQVPKPNLQVLQYIQDTFQAEVQLSIKEDSQAPNHIAGQFSNFYQIRFDNRQLLQQFTKLFKQKQQLKILTEDDSIVNNTQMIQSIQKLSEFDVQDGLRTSIDLDIRCGSWYDVTYAEHVVLQKLPEILLHPPIRSLAYDIETSKAPLCFPNAENGDSVMCISYMIDGQGVLVVNRSIFSTDIEDFEYSPTPEMKGEFKIFNCENEVDTIRTFFSHLKYSQPHIIVSYNGDQFDFKFLDQRSKILGIDFFSLTGFVQTETKGRFGSNEVEYKSRPCIHIDCYKWVKRDSYLPQGSQGLKAVTKAKLKYQPMELDPELMTPYAKLQPQILAQYSVSDAVATFYLYKQFIHSFILALCTIIPINPDAVLRKGTGTLCESLLMVKANEVNLLYPDKISNNGLQIIDFAADKLVENELTEALKENPSGVNSIQTSNYKQFKITDIANIQQEEHTIQDKKVLISQTYVGGRVEAIKAGVYRADFEYDFATNPNSKDGYQLLQDQLDQDLGFFVYTKFRVEIDKIEFKSRTKTKMFFPKESTFQFIQENLTDYTQIKQSIFDSLQILKLQSHTTFKSKPLIYHLDVSAMYPNIILTNRLQPHSIVSEKQCGTCDYNFPENNCKRYMSWIWRGIYYPCTFQEFSMVKSQVIDNYPSFEKMLNDEKIVVLQEALDTYCQKVYKTRSKTIETLKQSCNCQRENPFFVDTVRAFRDLRYVYKGRQKKHGNQMVDYENMIKNKQFQTEQERQILIQKSLEEKQLVVLNESLQLAHKAILNSFYGYAMRAGSRWYSLEMAACVTFIGSQIIRQARSLVELVGLPLELDTDGIWCMLPHSFPEIFSFKVKNQKDIQFEYPTIMLNSMTAKLFSNLQFQNRQSDIEDTFSHKFVIQPECSIEFELDGPYKCMFLSGAKEEGRQIKKRYAVFDFKNKISELKGFELKRRGELQIIKSFQQRIFGKFLSGTDLQTCYDSASDVANQFIDILYNEGKGYDSKLLQFLLQEQSTMKLSLVNIADNKKGTAITCAKRLSQAIDPIFAQVDGLCCVFVISRYPEGSPVSERSIPLQIFSCSPEKQLKFLKQWTGKQTTNIADILDWPYYWDRFQNQLYRILVVPAGLQGLTQSPISRIPYPDWLQKIVKNKDHDITSIMKFINNDIKVEDYDNEEESSDNENLINNKIVTVEDVLQYANINLTEIFDINQLAQLNVQKPKFFDRDSDYDFWIQKQKQKWKLLLEFQQLNNSVQQQNLLHQRSNSRLKGSTIFSQLGSLKQNNYLVLHVENLQVQGLIQALVIDIQSKQYSVFKIHVPQIFYINTKENIEEKFLNFQGKITRVNKLLPRNQKVFFLYEVIMSQKDYLAQKEMIMQVKNSPLVQNIYELQFEPISRFILNIGCHITLQLQAQRDHQYGGIIQFQDISTNKQFTTQTKSYKQNFFLNPLQQQNYQLGILSHLQTDQGDIAIFIYQNNVILFSTCSDEVLDDQKLKQLTYDRLLSKLTNHPQFCTNLFTYLDIKNSSFQLIKLNLLPQMTFLNQIQQHISFKFSQSTLFFYSSNQLQKQFFKLVNDRCLFVNFPIQTQNQSISDNVIELILQFSSLDVYMQLSEVPIINLLDTKQIYQKHVSQMLISSDFIFGRILQTNNHVLWWSKMDSPDLGKDINQAENILPDYGSYFEYPGHYQGYTVVFDFKYVVAEVLLNIFNNSTVKSIVGGVQVKLFQKFIQVIQNSAVASSMYSYVEQYIQEEESYLFDNVHLKLVLEQLGEYIQQIYNHCFTSDIQPVSINQKVLFLSTNKIQEHLATNQLNIFVQNLQSAQLLKIAKIIYKQCYKQLLFIDKDNFYAYSITNTLNKKTYLTHLLPLALNKSLELILGSFLVHCADLTGVSLLQVQEIDQLPIQFFKYYRLKQLELYSKEQQQIYNQPSFSLLQQITSILQLSLVVPDSPFQSKLLNVYQFVSPQSLYLTSIRDFLSLSQPIKDDVKTLIDSLESIVQCGKIGVINPLYCSIYCEVCNDFYIINFSKQISKILNCDVCGGIFNELLVEEKLIHKFKKCMKQVQFDAIIDFQRVAEIRDYSMLGSIVQVWKQYAKQ